MEFRYVFRRVEDAIGAPLAIEESLHSHLTRKLRHDYRETRDIARHNEITVLCLASMAGNPNTDTDKLGQDVADMLDEILMKFMPYTRKELEARKAPKEQNFDEYFQQLEEMKRGLEAEKAIREADAR